MLFLVVSLGPTFFLLLLSFFFFFNFFFLKTLFFLDPFKAYDKLRGYRGLPRTPSPHGRSLLTINVTHQGGTFTKEKPAVARRGHPKTAADPRVRAWYWTF